MSFTLLTRRSLLSAPTLSRSIRTSVPLQKTLTDSVKDAAQKVNKAAGDAALKGINVGEKVTDTVKENAAPLVGKAKDAASDVSTEASKKGSDVSNAASKAASDLKTEADKAGKDVKNAANKA